MARSLLILLFVTIFGTMLAATVYASLERDVLEAGRELMPDRWFQATLIDAYLGFLTFYVWVAYKEPGWWRKAVWLALIMTLGNMAMSAYVLLQLAGAERDRPVESILLRSAAPSA